MYSSRWILFIADKTEKQVYFVCPVIVKGFWESYIKEQPNDALVDTLQHWVDSVPVNLRRKIQTFKGNFIKYNDLKSLEDVDSTRVYIFGVMDIVTASNPNLWIKQASDQLKKKPNS